MRLGCFDCFLLLLHDDGFPITQDCGSPEAIVSNALVLASPRVAGVSPVAGGVLHVAVEGFQRLGAQLDGLHNHYLFLSGALFLVPPS